MDIDFIVYDQLKYRKAFDIIYSRQKGQCYYCGIFCNINSIHHTMKEKHQTFVLDHYIPRSCGGNNKLSNLIGSCYLCNARKGKMSAEDFKNKYKLSFNLKVL